MAREIELWSAAKLVEINRDESLSPVQKRILGAIVVHTEPSREVRATQAQIAEEAGLSVRTIKKYYTNKFLEQYFFIDRKQNFVHLVWKEDKWKLLP